MQRKLETAELQQSESVEGRDEEEVRETPVPPHRQESELVILDRLLDVGILRTENPRLAERIVCRVGSFEKDVVPAGLQTLLRNVGNAIGVHRCACGHVLAVDVQVERVRTK